MDEKLELDLEDIMNEFSSDGDESLEEEVKEWKAEVFGEDILDEQGRKQLRDEYYIDGINCEPMFFEKECEMVNKKGVFL